MNWSRIALVTTLSLAIGGCNWIELVSVNSSGEQVSGSSFEAKLSANGRYAVFTSYASGLVAGDTNADSDIFVRDILLGTTVRVSVDSASNQGDGSSRRPDISADGRYVAFLSSATNLVPGDSNNYEDIFVRDLQTGITERVSVDSAGNQSNFYSNGKPAISANGRFVAFGSWATNLVAGDTNKQGDIFVHDRQTGLTTRVSVDGAGNQADDLSESYPSISDDGRYVAFTSNASNLVAADTNNRPDIFVHDRQTGTTSRVSVDSAGSQYVTGSVTLAPKISGDGRFVAFHSGASDLVPDDNNGVSDVFVHDRQSGETTRVSVTSAGVEGDRLSREADISYDGRYVSFESAAENIAAPDSNWGHDIFVHDRQTGITVCASVDIEGIRRFGGNFDPALSADGRYVAWGSTTKKLVVPNTTSDHQDVFIKAVPVVSVDAVVPNMLPIGAVTPVTISGAYFLSGTLPRVLGGDVQLDNVVVVNESTITADAVVDSDADPGSRSVLMFLLGSGAGDGTGSGDVCADCLTVF